MDDEVLDGWDFEDALAVDALMGWDTPPACATCSQPLTGDPVDEPGGDSGVPICGACNRARNVDVNDKR